MAFCRRCGAYLEPGTFFCHNCGTSVTDSVQTQVAIPISIHTRPVGVTLLGVLAILTGLGSLIVTGIILAFSSIPFVGVFLAVTPAGGIVGLYTIGFGLATILYFVTAYGFFRGS